jgi:hypothetical protein
MCDHLQISKVKIELWKMIEARLDAQNPDPHALGLSPWEAFKARLAFSRYGYKFDDICKQPPAAYEGIPPRYIFEMVLANYHSHETV